MSRPALLSSGCVVLFLHGHQRLPIFLVANRAQRCEIHKPTVFGGWEGRGLACESRT